MDIYIYIYNFSLINKTAKDNKIFTTILKINMTMNVISNSKLIFFNCDKLIYKYYIKICNILK